MEQLNKLKKLFTSLRMHLPAGWKHQRIRILRYPGENKTGSFFKKQHGVEHLYGNIRGTKKKVCHFSHIQRNDVENKPITNTASDDVPFMISLFLHDYSWDAKQEPYYRRVQMYQTGLHAGFVSTRQNI